MCDILKSKFWQIVPNSVNEVIGRELAIVHKDYRRRGIAAAMSEMDLDEHKLRERGIDGLVSEASSLANQELLRKKGYEELARIEHSTITDKHGKQIINCDDGTTAMILFFKRIK